MIKDESPTSNERRELTVSIIANSAIVRAGLETLVASDGRFVVIESAAQFFSSSNLPFDSSTDVILFDAPNLNDLTQIVESQNQFAEQFTINNQSSIVILISTSSMSRSDLQDIFHISNVRGILSREASADEILSAIESVSNNLFAIAPEIFEIFLSNSNDDDLSFEIGDDLKINATQTEFVEKLTRRELETLELLAEGVGNKAIAARLNISEHTVKFHIASIFGKLSVTTRTEAVTEGLRRGLILL